MITGIRTTTRGIIITIMDMPITTDTSPAIDQSLSLASLLQTTDSLFPSGGYAHSYGLEELVALGRVVDSDGLEEFLKEEILPAMERLELPYLRFCHEAAVREDIDALLALDEEISAWKLCREIREAGQNQGRQLLRMLDQVFENEFAREFTREAQVHGASCQQITACGILRAAQGVTIESGLVAWVYQAVSNFCSASIKLLRLGEVACQRLIRSCLEPKALQNIVRQSLQVERSQAGWFNPVLDVASARHELAFSRLFIS
ncbi:MAG: urease accessory UreF family protein [Opitutales bacterium]